MTENFLKSGLIPFPVAGNALNGTVIDLKFPRQSVSVFEASSTIPPMNLSSRSGRVSTSSNSSFDNALGTKATALNLFSRGGRSADRASRRSTKYPDFFRDLITATSWATESTRFDFLTIHTVPSSSLDAACLASLAESTHLGTRNPVAPDFFDLGFSITVGIIPPLQAERLDS